ncbi:PREDICTED: uncharacterized protein LOC106338383 [Brassica oleracea var. oleracea]|uniref:uncharacterized protein LOC106338383 n=1 Tax=Brassica oleracea var. oleracea TaxID=109376 RepID=UPI0006A707F2|nr:PREDICTED: uncharacterized protein LOC106338383 [Brassica oleracea var. oleracea]
MEVNLSSATSNRLAVDHYDNPFFLHNSDHAGLALVTDRLASGADFHAWRRLVCMALNVRNKLGFIDGTNLKPPDNHRDSGAWSRCNDMVSTWLMNSVSKKIGQSLLLVNNAEGMWKNLMSRFKQDDAPRIYEIEQKLSNIQQGSLDISTYYTELITLWEEYQNYVDLPLQQWSRVMKFLMGLNEAYEATRRHILMLKPIPSLEEVFNMNSISDSEASVYAGPTENMAYATMNNNYRGKPRPICTHCGLAGHIVQKCFKLHGYPPGHRYHNATSQWASSQASQTGSYSQRPPQNKPNQSSSGLFMKTNSVAHVASPNPSSQSQLDLSSFHPNQVQHLIQQLQSHARASASTSHSSHSSSSLGDTVPETETVAAETEVPVQNTTRTRRHGKAPSYLLDCHCSLIYMDKALSYHFVSNITTSFPSLETCSTPCHPISSVLSYDNIKPSFKNVILTCSLETAPNSFKQAIKSVIWTKTMNVEFQGMALNKTFSVVSLPPGKNVVGCRWIYTIKYNADGSVERPKARLVAKGYTELEGLDYTDTFSPLAKMTSVKLLLALAANHGWSISQMDITNAFLHSDLDEEIYMSLPLDIHLLRVKCYHQIQSVNFISPSMDSSRRLVSGTIASSLFFLQMASHLLRVIIHYLSRLLELHSLPYCKYALDLLADTCFLASKPCAVHMDPSIPMSKDTGVLLLDATPYRELIGRLLYLTITRPYITFAVHRLSQFLYAPTYVHMQAAHRILRCKSKKQLIVSQSSTEAKYRGMAQVTCELIWLQQLLTDLQIKVQNTTKLFYDNKSAIHIATNPVFHERTKHIEIDCHTIHDQVK